MKMIIAMIRPEKLQNVKDALSAAGQHGMTIISARGRGEQSGLQFTTRVGTIMVDELEKTRIEICVEDEMEGPCIDAIISAANTGHMGDGRIFVLPVEKSIRIRQD